MDYYPGHSIGAQPIHPVTDWSKVRRIARAMRRGDNIPAVVIDGQIGNCSLVTGTHRVAAAELLGMLGTQANIQTISVDDLDNAEDIKDLLDQGDYSRINWLLDR